MGGTGRTEAKGEVKRKKDMGRDVALFVKAATFHDRQDESKR